MKTVQKFAQKSINFSFVRFSIFFTKIKSVHLTYRFRFSFTVSVAEFNMGIGCGWLAPALKKLLQDPTNPIIATAEECSWIASLYKVGKTLGSILCMSLLDILGRSFMLRTGSTIIFLAWLIVILTRSVQAIILARFSFGLAVGICDVITSIYLGENCSAKIRGFFCCMSVTSFYCAVLLAYILATYLSYSTTAIISSSISLLCILSTLLAIESPQFLTLRGKFQKAEQNLMWLRGATDREQIVAEYDKIKSNIESEKLKKASYKELLSDPANYKSVIIVFIISTSRPGTGSAVLFAYIAIMFPSTQILSSNQFTIWYGIVQLISAVLCSIFIEKFNRRTISLISYSVFIITNISIALLYYTNWYSSPWMIFILIGIYACFSVVMDSVFYMLRGELFPQSIKPFGCGLCNIGQAAIGFTTVKVFLNVAAVYGMHVNFVIYAIVSLFTLIFCYFALPETRGKSLIEIQRIFEKKT